MSKYLTHEHWNLVKPGQPSYELDTAIIGMLSRSSFIRLVNTLLGKV